jgi:hypothetical protein
MMVDYEDEIAKSFLKEIREAYKWSGVEFDEDKMKSSPSDLYLHSLRIQQRLPQELHDAMMLWSFHPDGKEHARMYLEWVEHCELREESRIRFERRMKNIERFHSLAMVACGIGLFIVFLSSFF